MRACEVIDECIGKVVDAAMSKKGKMIITADHGNIEQLIDYDTGYAAHGPYDQSGAGDFSRRRAKKSRLNKGTAIDVAPTVLQLLGLPQPEEMTGHSLIVDSNRGAAVLCVRGGVRFRGPFCLPCLILLKSDCSYGSGAATHTHRSS